jgi:hypothetical protein
VLFAQLAATALEVQIKLAMVLFAPACILLFLIGQLFVQLDTTVKLESMLLPRILVTTRISLNLAQKEVMEDPSV